MNRSERRRQARRAARELGAHIEERAERGETPMGFLYSGTGEFAPAQRDRDLPPKVPGEHRWIATTAFILTDDDVRTEMRAQDGSGERQYLDNRNLFFIGIGCYDCELPLGEIEPGSHCPDPGDAR